MANFLTFVTQQLGLISTPDWSKWNQGCEWNYSFGIQQGKRGLGTAWLCNVISNAISNLFKMAPRSNLLWSPLIGCILIASYRNIRRDVRACIGSQRNHHCLVISLWAAKSVVFTIFFQAFTWARILVVILKNTKNVLGIHWKKTNFCTRQYNLNETILTNKEEMTSYTQNYR